MSQEQINNVAEPTKSQALVKQFKELNEAISDSRCAMHHREFSNAYYTGEDYLGEDVVYLAKGDEYKALPEDKKKILKDQQYLGEYGMFFHSQKQELTVALEVVQTLKAREIIKEGLLEEIEKPDDKELVLKKINLEEETKQFLQDFSMAEKILTTWPHGKITQEHIKQAMTSYTP